MACSHERIAVAPWRDSHFDQKDTSGAPTYASTGLRRKRAKASPANPQLAIRETGNRTYTASGLVAEYVERLYADDEYVVVGGLESGFSRLVQSDLAAPRGKACNYKGRDSNDVALRFGLSGFAKGTADDRIYAWYGRDIVDVLDLDSLAIKGTLGSDGNAYWDAAETWALDRDYEFHDVIPVPHEDAVFIAVGEHHSVSPMPCVLKYSYADNAFTRVNLPDPSCEGIRALATDGQVVYGAARKKLCIYEDGAWQEFCDLEMGNDFRGMKIANRHLFIISGWNSDGEGESGGMEVVDLREKTTGYYDSTRIPIASDAIFAIEIQGVDNDTFKLWLGGPNGLSYCEFRLED